MIDQEGVKSWILRSPPILTWPERPQPSAPQSPRHQIIRNNMSAEESRMPDELAAAMRRLDMNERNQSDFAKSLTEVVKDIHELRKPLDELRTDREVRKVRDEALNDRLARIEKRIDGVYKLGLWVLAAFGASLIALVSNFLFTGGFHVS